MSLLRMTPRSSAGATRSFVAAGLVLSLLSVPTPDGAAAFQSSVRDVIVVLAESTDVASSDHLAGDPSRTREVVGAVAATHRAAVRTTYVHAVTGFAATLPDSRVAALRADPRVAYVEYDQPAFTLEQIVPTGVRRVFAPDNEALAFDGADSARVDADIAVLDTGIDDAHPDLSVVSRVDCRAGCVAGGPDRHGHGTHVAGTAAAIDNGTGVVGVAPGARLWSVKVLGDDGHGGVSDVIAGIDWVTARAGAVDVANLSLGISSQSSALDAAVTAAVDAGVIVVAAAGNQRDDVANHSPANHPDTIAVSSIADFDGQPGGLAEARCQGGQLPGESDDTFASHSNYGAGIDLAAPGVCIVSTLPGGYGVKTGTSMAAPHVAGAAALLASALPPTDRAEVEAIRQALVSAGNFDWEDTSGDGVHEPLLDASTLEPALVSTTAPSITLTAPDDGATLVGTTTLAAEADTGDEGEVATVEFLVDGMVVGTVDAAPYTLDWDSTAVPDGPRLVTARATNDAGLQTSAVPALVTVDNDPPDVMIESPAADGLLRGTVEVRVSATDAGSGVDTVAVVAADDLLASTQTAEADPGMWVADWETTAVKDGTHSITVRAVDHSGHETTVSVRVLVDNTAPNVTLTGPTAGSTVAGTVTLSAEASDAHGVDEVRFFVDGELLRSVSSEPYTTTWDTTGLDDGTHELRVEATDAAGNTATTAPVSVEVDNSDAAGGDGSVDETAGHEVSAERIHGPDRFATAAAIAARTHPNGVDMVYVASGLAFPDALAAGAIAESRGAPVLLTARRSLPPATADALAALAPERIVLAGGTAAVSSEVADALREYAPVTRIAGDDRFATAAALARDAYPGRADVVHVVSGLSFADALSAGPAAGVSGGPLLLVAREHVPDATKQALAMLAPEEIVIVGGDAVVGAAVADDLSEHAPVRRVAGPDRFATAAALADAAFEHTAAVVLATGSDFADALAGTPFASGIGAPILLVAAERLPDATADTLTEQRPREVFVLGGTAAVDEKVVTAAVAASR